MVLATEVEAGNKKTSFTCSASVAIPKNTILTLSDPRTVAAVSATPVATSYIFGGFATMDKDSADTSTRITATQDGIWDVYASGSITVGQFVKSCGTGYFMAATAADIASGAICGRALETASDGEKINVRFGVL